MRAALVLVAAVTLVTACTPATSAPAEGSPSAGSLSSAGRLPSTMPTPTPTSSQAAPDFSPSGVPTTTATPSSSAAGSPGLLAASSAASGPPLPPNPYELGGPAPVGSFVLGDSISLSAGVGPVLARLGYPVLGVEGQSASDTYLRTHLAGPTAQSAPAWVIALGTNNTADPADVARLTGWVELIDSLRSPSVRQKVYWVTPHRPPSFVGSKSRWTLDAFNAELKRLDAPHGWLRIIDFDAVARAHPEWFEQDVAMHLHPDSRGQGVLVALIAGPDAVPVEIPAPLFTGPASAEPEPETFVNGPRPAASKATPTPAPASPAMPSSTPVPLEPPAPDPDASSDVAVSPAPIPTTSDEASPVTPG